MKKLFKTIFTIMFIKYNSKYNWIMIFISWNLYKKIIIFLKNKNFYFKLIYIIKNAITQKFSFIKALNHILKFVNK